MAGLSEYGRAIWDGTAGVAQPDKARSLFTDVPRSAVSVGCVILPDAMNSAEEPGAVGMVIDIDHDRETGEAVYTLVRYRHRGGVYTARTLAVRASQIGSGCVVPDSASNRHVYAKALVRAAGVSSNLTERDERWLLTALALVKDCRR